MITAQKHNLIRYTGILEKYGVGSVCAREFRQQLIADDEFNRRAAVLEELIEDKPGIEPKVREWQNS